MVVKGVAYCVRVALCEKLVREVPELCSGSNKESVFPHVQVKNGYELTARNVVRVKNASVASDTSNCVFIFVAKLIFDVTLYGRCFS